MIGTHHITIFAATLYIAAITLFVALHLADRQQRFLADAVSNYALGPASGLFVVYVIVGSVAALCLGTAVLASGLLPVRVGVYLLALTALRGGILVFRVDRPGEARTTSGKLHYAFAVATFALTYMVLSAAAVPADRIAGGAFNGTNVTLSWVTALALAGVVLCLLPAFRATIGLAERLFLGSSLLGLTLLSIVLAQAT